MTPKNMYVHCIYLKIHFVSNIYKCNTESSLQQPLQNLLTSKTEDRSLRKMFQPLNILEEELVKLLTGLKGKNCIFFSPNIN